MYPTFVAFGEVEKGLLAFADLEVQSFQHSVFQGDDLIQTFCLSVKRLHDLAQLLTFAYVLVHSHILCALQFGFHQSLQCLFFLCLLYHQVLDPLLVDVFSLVKFFL